MRDISKIVGLIAEVDKLKLIARASYVGDASRKENSAEHSWHLAFALLVFAGEFKPAFDIHRALKMALVHDICEIDAGDTPAYGATRQDQFESESESMDRFAKSELMIGREVSELWHEYEAQQSMESKWVKVMDRLMPFISNLMTEGKLWQEKSITRSQVLKLNLQVKEYVPEIYEWMSGQVDEAVAKKWLVDA